jgi:hypothetical protein
MISFAVGRLKPTAIKNKRAVGFGSQPFSFGEGKNG